MAVIPHLKLVFRGTVLNTPEEWSISLKFKSDAPFDIDPGTGNIHADQILDAGQAYFAAARFSQWMQWEEWRAYNIGTNGLMDGNPRVEPLASADFVKGTGALKYPPQVSVCVTTVGTERGPARFGRWFLPCPALSITSDHRLSQADATEYAEASSTFAKDVSGAIDIPTSQANAPLINVSNIGTGTNQEVDHIEVGRVLDTQRRRRNQLLEERVSTGHIDW